MHNNKLHFWIWCIMPHSNRENNFNLWPSPLAWWEIHWHHYRFQRSKGKYPLEGSLISALTLEKNTLEMLQMFLYFFNILDFLGYLISTSVHVKVFLSRSKVHFQKLQWHHKGHSWHGQEIQPRSCISKKLKQNLKSLLFTT